MLAHAPRSIRLHMPRARSLRYASERASFDPATGQISWPLVLLYPEAHHSDFVQDVCEDNTLNDYIEVRGDVVA